MKKLILIFATLFSIANYMAAQISRTDGVESSNKPGQMVVEGRTWWYDAPVAGLNNQDFGFRIAAPVEIDGEAWYPVQQIRYLVEPYNGKPELSDEAITLCHIRQVGSKIYTRISYNNDAIKNHPLFHQFFGPCQNLVYSPDITESATTLEIQLYGESGEKFIYSSDDTNPDKDFMELTFGNSNLISNSGNEYMQFELTNTERRCAFYDMWETTIYSVPEFGYTDSSEFYSELFFAPMGVYFFASYPYQVNPRLRYVTDADNNILFEGKGGFKLWEYDPAGTEDVQIAPESEDETWFTLDGRKVGSPAAGGIYIRRAGSKIEKVVKK
ncbi:MAG: hypothetical protein K2M19_04920 [Muribaculaceae bacterium]|nr:hypothetical protein [Muribaculaceae bacterium]